MKIYFLLILLTVGLFTASAKAQTENTEINKTSDWKLYGSDTQHDIEFYYNANNMKYIAGEQVFITLKTVYKGEKAINKLKKVRSENSGITGLDTDAVKYNNLAYTIEAVRIDCDRKVITMSDSGLDFDKENNILNKVPNVSTPSPIQPDSHADNIYNIVCPQQREQ